MKTAMEIRNAQNQRKNELLITAKQAAVLFVDKVTEELFNDCSNCAIYKNKMLMTLPDYSAESDCDKYFRDEFEKAVCNRFKSGGFEILYYPNTEMEISW